MTAAMQPTMQTQITFPGALWRRPVFFSLAILNTLGGALLMLDILRANSLTVLEVVILLLFVVTFGWIVVSFWSALAGFLLQWLRRDPLTLARQAPVPAMPIHTRTAVVMPVYNEETRRVIAGFEATLRGLAATGEARHFDFFLLSDSTDEQVARTECAAWQALRERLPAALREQVFYRRRTRNTGRKVGNLKDFCERWGSHYEHMIVLDADSVMRADCLLDLVRLMQANPRCGLIQTVPIPVRATTFFGRFVQFAAAMYSPMLATGMSFWQMDAANYWGHNAIIRTRAFIEHCGLPALPGKPPLGGDILSHDFVEAAMLRRAGWQVLLRADLGGSYEEIPSNMLDYAKRDRRWVQGNIQHLGLLNAQGLHPVSRVHFLFGAVAYIASLLWLLMLVLSTADAVFRALHSEIYFANAYQLFPDWPIVRTELIITLVVMTVALLLLPKGLGVLIALRDRRRAFGGAWRILCGALVEMLFAILIAPLMMVFHAWFVISILLGRNVSWDAQVREGRPVPWAEALLRTLAGTLVALAWGLFTWWVAPMFFWWLTPILAGLILAAPIVRYSSSLTLGRVMRRLGVFVTPDEACPEPVLQAVAAGLAARTALLPEAPLPALPPERPVRMPMQTL